MTPFPLVKFHALQTAIKKSSRSLSDRYTTVKEQVISGPIAHESFTGENIYKKKRVCFWIV